MLAEAEPLVADADAAASAVDSQAKLDAPGTEAVPPFAAAAPPADGAASTSLVSTGPTSAGELSPPATAGLGAASRGRPETARPCSQRTQCWCQWMPAEGTAP